MVPEESDIDRRRFRRVQAPILCRPVGGFFRKVGQPVQNISLGGLRVFSDEPHKRGDQLEVELFLPDGDTVIMIVEIVWLEELPEGGPAKFDLGMRFVQLRPNDYLRLQQVLDPLETKP